MFSRRRPPRAFQRFVLANPSTTRCPVINEIGLSIDLDKNAGPAFYDYTAVQAMSGLELGEGGGNLISANLFGRNREISLVLCDPRLMGMNVSEDWPIGTDDDQLYVQWEDCEYAVITNLEVEIVLAAPYPQDTKCYVGGVETPTILDPNMQDVYGDEVWGTNETGEGYGLNNYLDDLVIGAVEAEGGDVWANRAENYEAPYAVTLMRCPLQGAQSDTTNDVTSADDLDNNTPLGLAPLNLLMREELGNIGEYLTSSSPALGDDYSAYDPRHYLEGTEAFDANGLGPFYYAATRWNDRQYKAWEFYDQRANAGILAREFYTFQFTLNNNFNVQDVTFFDDEITEGFESSGNEAYPTWSRARRTHRIRLRYDQPIICSINDKRPLVLHIAGLPCRLNSGTDSATGEDIHEFYRPFIIPIRWHASCNIKIR